MWSSMIIKIRFRGVFADGPLIWSKMGSFFWTGLLAIKNLFDWSTEWNIGDGYRISY